MKCFKWQNGDKRNNVFDVYFLLCNFLDQERQFRNFNRFHSMIKTHPRLYIYIYKGIQKERSLCRSHPR